MKTPNPRSVLAALAAAALLAAVAAPAHAQTSPCRFQLGFADLARLLGDRAGTCREDQRSAANGNAEQRTTGGLMVWRKSDNWTAFTDGYRTWINGPNGLEERLNTERFAWEPDYVAPPPPPPGPAVAGTDVGVPAASMVLQVNVLSVERAGSRAAPAGKDLLTVRVNLAPGTRGIGSYDYLDFRVRSREGYEYRAWAGTPSLPHGIDRGTLQKGQWVEGELQFEVAKDASGFTLIHDYQGKGAPQAVITRRLDALA